VVLGWVPRMLVRFMLFILPHRYNNDFNCTLLGYLNDMWRYNVNDDVWTWMSGNDTINEPGNYGEKGKTSADSYPGARAGATRWYDSSRRELWIFGGQGIDGNFGGFGALKTYVFLHK